MLFAYKSVIQFRSVQSTKLSIKNLSISIKTTKIKINHWITKKITMKKILKPPSIGKSCLNSTIVKFLLNVVFQTNLHAFLNRSLVDLYTFEADLWASEKDWIKKNEIQTFKIKTLLEYGRFKYFFRFSDGIWGIFFWPFVRVTKKKFKNNKDLKSVHYKFSRIVYIILTK